MQSKKYTRKKTRAPQLKLKLLILETPIGFRLAVDDDDDDDNDNNNGNN